MAILDPDCHNIQTPDLISIEEAILTETHTGGCSCGNVRYQVHGKPVFSTVCHCRFCQRRLASAFAVIASFDEKSVEIIRGELAECEHRSDESGRWLRMSFCPRCATTISHTAEVRPGLRSIAAGTFDDCGWFEINRHIWVQSKQPWVTVPTGVASYMQGAPTGPQPPATD